MFNFLKKIDWATVGTIAAVSTVSVLTAQALARNYQVANTIASLPDKAVGMLKKITG